MLEDPDGVTRNGGPTSPFSEDINPGNPTGALLDEASMREVVDVAREHGLAIIADEVYQENTYGRPWTSFAQIVGAEEIPLFSLHSVSKGFYGECGHRGGYLEVRARRVVGNGHDHIMLRLEVVGIRAPYEAEGSASALVLGEVEQAVGKVDVALPLLTRQLPGNSQRDLHEAEGGAQSDCAVPWQSDGTALETVEHPLGKTQGAESVEISLSSVAEVLEVEGPAEIRRSDGTRVARITANLDGRDLGSAASAIESELGNMSWPSGYDWRLGGQEEEMKTSFASMKLAIGLAVFLVYLVMASQFEDLLHPFVILFAVPFAAIGALATMWLFSITVNLVSMIGFVNGYSWRSAQRERPRARNRTKRWLG